MRRNAQATRETSDGKGMKKPSGEVEHVRKPTNEYKLEGADTCLLTEVFGSLGIQDRAPRVPTEAASSVAKLSAAAAARPFNQRDFRLHKLRLMPYSEILESRLDYDMAKEHEVDLAQDDAPAKRLKASVALANRMKVEKSMAMKALMPPARVRRLRLKKAAKQRDDLEAAKPGLDRFWAGVMEQRKSIVSMLSRSSRE